MGAPKLKQDPSIREQLEYAVKTGRRLNLDRVHRPDEFKLYRKEFTAIMKEIGDSLTPQEYDQWLKLSDREDFSII